MVAPQIAIKMLFRGHQPMSDGGEVMAQSGIFGFDSDFKI
jgi:hypothetical protein